MSLWSAIQYVSTGVTLLAFLGALAAWIHRRKIKQIETLIQSVPEEQRLDAVQDALEWFHIDTSSLSRKDKFDLAVSQISLKEKRFRLTAILVFGVAVLAAAVAALSIYFQSAAANTKPAELPPAIVKIYGNEKIDFRTRNIRDSDEGRAKSTPALTSGLLTISNTMSGSKNAHLNSAQALFELNGRIYRSEWKYFVDHISRDQRTDENWLGDHRISASPVTILSDDQKSLEIQFVGDWKPPISWAELIDGIVALGEDSLLVTYELGIDGDSFECTCSVDSKFGKQVTADRIAELREYPNGGVFDCVGGNACRRVTSKS